MKHTDWMSQVTRLLLTNQIALFECRVVRYAVLKFVYDIVSCSLNLNLGIGSKKHSFGYYFF